MHPARVTAFVVVFICAIVVVVRLATAGDLNPPPGPVQPTGPTLLNAQSITFPFVIAEPGTYLLTSNLTVPVDTTGIIIDADDVTLELGGFSLMGLGGVVGDGVYVQPGRSNVEISGGVLGGYAGTAVRADDAPCAKVRGVRATNNGGNGIAVGPFGKVRDSSSEGNLGAGILTGEGSAVSRVKSRGNAGDGVRAGAGSLIRGVRSGGNVGAGIAAGKGSVIRDSTADGNKGGGIRIAGGATQGCVADGNTGYGFWGSDDATFKDCVASGNEGPGFTLDGSGGAVLDCTSAANRGHGIVTGANGLIRGNTCQANADPESPACGVTVRFHGNRIESNTCVGNEFGIAQDEDDTGINIILRNTAHGNTIAPFVLGSSAHGPIVFAVGDLSLTPAAGHPWANFAF